MRNKELQNHIRKIQEVNKYFNILEAKIFRRKQLISIQRKNKLLFKQLDLFDFNNTE